jgi:hypothetical protein
MTKLLEKAFEKASQLPGVEQNVLARWMLEELGAERKWEESFAGSEDVLDKLADETLVAHGQGKTRILDIDKL